jgi:hypothetical protein
MRLRRRKRSNPEPEHGRDEFGRLVDGDTVRLPGWPGWTDALAAHPADPWHGATMILPTVGGPLLTRGARWRAEQAGSAEPRP